MSSSSVSRPPARSIIPSVPPVNSAYIHRERPKTPFGAGSSPIPIPNHRRHGSFGTGYETDVRPSTRHVATPPGQRGRTVKEEERRRDHEEMVRKEREAFQRQQQERARQRPPSAPPTASAYTQLPSRTFLHAQGMEARSKEGHTRKGSHDGRRRENPPLPDEHRALLQEVKAREESLARRQEALAREKAKYARQEAELRKLEATKAAKGAITKSWSRSIPTEG